jgi:hypothetical protein
VWRLAPFAVVVPNLAAVFAAYLGVTARGAIAGPMAAAIAIGYLADLLGGTPPGLMAFVAGALTPLSRAATTRLLVRGRGFVMVLCGAISLVSAALTLALRAYHGARVDGLAGELVTAIGCALITSVVAIPVFRLLRLIDARFARTQREREAVLEGHLN